PDARDVSDGPRDDASGGDAARRSPGPRPADSRPPGRIRLARWADDRVAEWEGAAALSALTSSPKPADVPGSTLWIDLADPDQAMVSRIAAVLGLHPLIAEDVV